MATGDFLQTHEETALAELIGAVEKQTTGEIRVHLAHKLSRHGALADAAKAFKKLGMQKTTHHNGVLIFVATGHRKLAVIGDKGIHSKIGDDGWKKVANHLTEHFKRGENYAGLRQAIEEVGAVLKAHFPSDGSSHANDLSNDVSRS